MLTLQSPLSDCPFLRGTELASLTSLGVSSIEDFLRRAPQRVEDRRQFDHIPIIASDTPICLRVRIIDTQWRNFNHRFRCFDITVQEPDEILSGQLICRWFQFPGISKILASGMELIIYGKASSWGKSLVISHPEFEILDDRFNLESSASIHLNRIVPIYKKTGGIAQRRYRELVWLMLEHSTLPHEEKSDSQERAGSTKKPLNKEFSKLHFPQSQEEFIQAREHFALEECFLLQLAVIERKNRIKASEGLITATSTHLLKDLLALLPFKLTDSQQHCIKEIHRDMKAGTPMNRLLQGDVGSGKTLVSLCASLLAIESGYQVALMAPTQILAEQHYKTCSAYLAQLDITCELLSGAQKKTQEPLPPSQLLIGTHALLHRKNIFHNLGLVIIDEQHKFGVNQRETLIKKGNTPDVLVMTATPIPRTLTLTLYGDLDLSLLTEKPAHRGKIITALREEKSLVKIIPFLEKELDAGRQAFIVSPLVENSDIPTEEENTTLKPTRKRLAKSATAEFEAWKKLLPHHDIGLLHGRMSAEEKESIMNDFRHKRYSLLIATTVVEVGVDVPNATIMLINNADQFGLSQLHQLRGRVGRGSHTSYCILLSSPKTTNEKIEKLRTFESLNDGFALAEADFQLRGPGEIFGTTQSGLGELNFPEWLYNPQLIIKARTMAEKLLLKDPDLKKYPHLKKKIPRHNSLRN